MADNTTLNTGSGGDVIATDDIGGVKHQLVKVEYGAADSATQVDATNPLPVELGDGTNQASVDTDGALRVDSPNLVSTNNSTTATLGISATWTATADDVSAYSAVTIQLDSSHDSATDGMTFQFSTDNSNWDDIYTFTYTAANGARRFQFPVTAQYFRNVYTNGGTGQTHFRVQTILHRGDVGTSIHRLEDSVSPDRSAEVVKSAIVAQAAGSGDFVPVSATAGGGLKTDLSEIDGNAPDLGAGNAGSGTQRVILATDQPSVTVDAAVGTPVHMQIVDGVDQAEVTAAGRLEVDGSGVTHPISAASLPLPSGAATSANQLANGHDVTIDNASGASAVNIQDGGNTITVDGSVDVGSALPAGDNNIGNVDVVTLPALAAGTNNIGDVDVLTLPAIPAGTNNIGDVDVLTQPARDRTTDNVGVAIQTDVLMDDVTALTPKFANIDTATSGNTAIVAAVAGKTIRVLSVFVACTAAVNIYWNDGTGNLMGGTRLIKLDNTGAAGAVGFSLPFNPLGWFETGADNRPINLNQSGAIGVAGCLVYVEV